MTSPAVNLTPRRRAGGNIPKSVRLDPALARIVEALADHMVDQDIRRLRASQPLTAFIAAAPRPTMSAESPV